MLIIFEITPLSIIDEYIKGDSFWKPVYSNTYFVYMTYAVSYIDKFGDLTGVLIISTENKDHEAFKRVYKITDRQMEIIYLLLEGYSNSEIAGKLGIKKKTIETHTLNIYNRLGINNKVELAPIGLEYNLVLRKGIL